MIQRTKCCGGLTATEPPTDCTTVGSDPTNHPSLPASHVASMGSSPSQETLAFGATANVSLTYNASVGRHRLSYGVQATADTWRVYHVLWFDSPAQLNPAVVGSFSRLAMGSSFKVRAAEGWTREADDPLFVAGIVLEQNGTQYFTEPIAAEGWQSDLSRVNPCCWNRLQVTAQDEECADGLVLGVHRADSAHRSTADEVVLSNLTRLVSDWFGELDADGVPNDDLRPRLDLYDDVPVDRVGIVLCLKGTRSGNFKLRGVFAPFCGSISTHGSYLTGGPNDTPVVPGTLVIDEALAAGVPSGWAGSPGLWLNDDSGSGPTLYGGPGASFTSRDGMTVNEPLSLGEYTSGAAWLPVTLPSAPPYAESFQIAAEVTWKRINDQDRRWLLTERPDGAPPTDRLHSQECGIVIAPFGKVTLGHLLNIASVGEPLTSTGLVRLSQALTPSGSLATWANLYPHKPYGWPCPCDELPDPSFCDGQIPDIGTYATNPSFTSYVACPGAIEDGTRLAMLVKRVPDSAFLSGGCIGDDWRAFRYYIEVWVNGRSLINAPWLPPPYLYLGWTHSTATINVGLVSHFGGAWKDLKVWTRL